MAASPPWRRRWVLLRGPQLFLYATPQDQKAECLLYVPGFVVSLAPDCKSKNCAFKLSNSENTFHFATESQADTSRWLTKLQQAAKLCPNYSGPCLWASDSDEDAALDNAMFKQVSSAPSFPSHKVSLVPSPLDRPRQPSPKPMPRTIFLRSTVVPPQLTDRSATLSPRRTTGEPPTTSASVSSLPRSRESSKSPQAALCPLSLELSSEHGDSSACSLTSKQRLSGAWDKYSDALAVVQPAKRDFSTAKSKPPSGLYMNVSFKHSSSAKEPSTSVSTSLPQPSESVLGGNAGNSARLPTLAPSSPVPSRAVQRRPSDSSKLSRSKTADNFPQMQTPKGETLLDREYNRVFKKSPSASSSPDPAALSDSPATSPVPLPVLTNSLMPRCATSQEIKDLYTNRRNSWRGSQQELMIPLSSVGSSDLGSPLDGCVQSPDYSFRDYSSPDYPSQRPDVIPSQYHHGRSRPPHPEEAGTDPWVPRGVPSPSQGVEQTSRSGGDQKLSSSSFLRAGSAPASACCQTAPSPTPTKTSSRFFHSPKFLKKFASSTREGLSNILRSPRLERKKLSAERDMYGSPKLSRSAGVRLLKSSASASAVSSSPAEVPEESSPSPLTHKSGSSSSLNSSTSAGSFVTSSSSSHCYAEVFAPSGLAPLARPETPETPRARPTMGVSMLRGKRRTSSSAAGSEERSFSPCSFASSAGGSGSGAPWARDDGSVFGEETSPGGGDAFQFGHGTDGSPESALGSGSERE
uniref:Putative pleckstrin similarity domain protein n=1 Tax=Hyalomma excavatum TaxID=257692 RepID=A0A131XH22_9ACAR